MQGDYAGLLAQVIPVIALALIVEMRQLEKRVMAARADAAPGRTRVGVVLAWLSFAAMAALTVSEVLCLLAVGGARLPRTLELLVLLSLFFAVIVTFLLPPAAWLRRLYLTVASAPSPAMRARKRTDRAPSGGNTGGGKVHLLDRDWVRSAVTGIVVVIIVGIVVIIGVFLLVLDVHLGFQSGDEPQISQGPSGCVSAGCAASPISYEWNLDPRERSTITATFVKQPLINYDLNVERLGGFLRHQMDGCPDARVEWKLQIGTSDFTSGILNAAQSQVQLDELAPRNIDKVTISARRTDDQPCGTVFEWSGPSILGSPW